MLQHGGSDPVKARNHGFTLIESVSALALTGMIALGSTALMSWMTSESVSVWRQMSRADLISQLKLALDELDRCTQIVENTKLPVPNEPHQPPVLQVLPGFTIQVGNSVGGSTLSTLAYVGATRVLSVDQGDVYFVSLELGFRDPDGSMYSHGIPLSLVTEKNSKSVVRCGGIRTPLEMNCPHGQMLRGFDANGAMVCTPLPALTVALTCPPNEYWVGISGQQALCARPRGSADRNEDPRRSLPPPPPPGPPPAPPEPIASPSPGAPPQILPGDYFIPGNYTYRVTEGIPTGKRIRIEITGAGGAGGGGHRDTGGGGGAGQGLMAEVAVNGGETYQIVVGAGGICPDNEARGKDGTSSSISGPGLSGGTMVARGGRGGLRDTQSGNCTPTQKTHGEAAPFAWAPGGFGASCAIYNGYHTRPGTNRPIRSCPGDEGCGNIRLGCPGQFGSGGGGGCDNYRGGDGGHGRVKITPL